MTGGLCGREKLRMSSSELAETSSSDDMANTPSLGVRRCLRPLAELTGDALWSKVSLRMGVAGGVGTPAESGSDRSSSQTGKLKVRGGRGAMLVGLGAERDIFWCDLATLDGTGIDSERAG